MQLSLFDIQKPIITENLEASERPSSVFKLEELFNAYFECRKNKRYTANALAFEMDYENNLVQLCEEINNGTYQIDSSIAFIVDKPVKREIFAADFRDRIVHHLIIGKLNQLFERQFIYDSYSCRVGKGTYFGIQRIVKFIRKCCENYTKDCYILKLDLQGFFMSINKDILFGKLQNFISEKYTNSDKNLIYVTSANNYVEIFYFYQDNIKHFLLRNTLQDIEKQISNFQKIKRCHKSFIINLELIDNVIINASGYKLKLKNCEEIIPISKTYKENIFEIINFINI